MNHNDISWMEENGYFGAAADALERYNQQVQQQQAVGQSPLVPAAGMEFDAVSASSKSTEGNIGTQQIPMIPGEEFVEPQTPLRRGSMASASRRGSTSRDFSVEELRERNEKRLLHNRISAKQSRERKKVFVTALEAQVEELRQQKVDLEQMVERLLWENEQLRADVPLEAIAAAVAPNARVPTHQAHSIQIPVADPSSSAAISPLTRSWNTWSLDPQSEQK
jgi:hypothetical protein